MRKYLLIMVMCLIIHPNITNAETKQINLNEPSAAEISSAHSVAYRDIDYMENNYSLPEFAQYAIQLHKALSQYASRNNTEMPEPLNADILSDKQKIGDYLRQIYKLYR